MKKKTQFKKSGKFKKINGGKKKIIEQNYNDFKEKEKKKKIIIIKIDIFYEKKKMLKKDILKDDSKTLIEK